MSTRQSSSPPKDGSDARRWWLKPPEAPYPRAVAATLLALFPFIVALSLALGFRVWATGQASDAIAGLAMEVRAAQTAKKPDKALKKLIEQGRSDASTNVSIRERLVVSLDAELRQGRFGAKPNRASIQERVFDTLLEGHLLADALLLGLLVLFFPALFGVMYFQAARGLTLAQALAASDQVRPHTLEDHIRAQRHLRWLTDEARALIWRRLTFALLIALGTNYLLSPAGLQASVIGEYASLRPSAGTPSHPFGFEYFREAPPYVVGIAGYYLYALTAFSGRFMAGNLSHRFLPSLINRAITVMILGLVLSGITEGEGLTRAIVFLAAVFPETGIQYLAKVAQGTSTPLSLNASAGFRDLPEIDVHKQAALAELGISSVHDLAASDLGWLVESVGIHPRLLIRAADHALLLHTVGVERTAKLAAVSVYTASDLVLYVRGADAYRSRWQAANQTPPHALVEPLEPAEQAARLAAAAKALEVDDASLLVAQLETSANVKFVIDNKVGYGGP